MVNTNDCVSWKPYARVDKYSADQSAYAERVRQERGLLVIEHDLLEELFKEPEDGYAESYGNLLVNGGLAIMTQLLIGTALTGSQMSNTYGFNGVGATSTAATTSDTVLGANGGSALYKGFDSSNPSQSGAVITGISTYSTSQGNFAWNEWCWGTSTVAVAASTNATLASLTAGTETMWNHKIASLGTKTSSATWVFTATITLS